MNAHNYISCNKFKILDMNKPWVNCFAFETKNMSQRKLNLPAKESLVDSEATSYVEVCVLFSFLLPEVFLGGLWFSSLQRTVLEFHFSWGYGRQSTTQWKVDVFLLSQHVACSFICCFFFYYLLIYLFTYSYIHHNVHKISDCA